MCSSLKFSLHSASHACLVVPCRAHQLQPHYYDGLTTHAFSNNIVVTMQAIHVTIRPIGNSRGVVLPKPVLVQAGLEDATDAEMTVENGAIILRKPAKPTREGWAEAAQRLAAESDDELVMGEFGNEDDAELKW